MRQAERLQAVTMGHTLDVESPGSGVVHSVFARAVNLDLRGELWTLVAAEKADLPFGIRVGLSNLDPLRLRGGEAVSVRAGFVGIGARLVVDCRAASRWAPACPAEAAPGLTERLDVLRAAARHRAWPGSERMAHAVRTALQDGTGLGPVLAQVVGRGPGATPAGDDVLVGALAALTSPRSGRPGARAAALLCRSLLPLLSTTSDVSGQLLRQAARGLFCRDLHELVAAVIADTHARDLHESVRRVIETGATSGGDACEGLLAFAPLFFKTHSEVAAA